jgi:hypothetical protein
MLESTVFALAKLLISETKRDSLTSSHFSESLMDLTTTCESVPSLGFHFDVSGKDVL